MRSVDGTRSPMKLVAVPRGSWQPELGGFLYGRWADLKRVLGPTQLIILIKTYQLCSGGREAGAGAS